MHLEGRSSFAMSFLMFDRIFGIDCSGAETPTAGLSALRVYLAENDAPPVEVPPPARTPP